MVEGEKVEQRGRYTVGKRLEYKVLYERKKEEENRRWERKALEARREKEVWKIVIAREGEGGE